MSPKPFTKSTAEKLLVKSHRHCCICHKFCGTKMEIHHIDQAGSSDEDNGIPLCFDCHAEVLAYNDKHPKGRKYSKEELKKHRDQWFQIASQSPFGQQDDLDSKSEMLKKYSVRIPVTGSTKWAGYDWEEFEDNRVFVFKKGASTSRKMPKTGYLSSLANIPVFIPSFTSLDSPPHIFNSKSVYVTSRPPCVGDLSLFEKTITEIEKRWTNGTKRSVYDSFNWSISENKQFTFGYGGANLISELQNHRKASVGVVLDGNFGENYSKTFFLVIYAYRKGDRIVDFGADFYLKTVPINWNWFQQILNSFQDSANKLDVTHFSFKELPIYCWKPKQHTIKLDIVGGLRRYGFRSKKIKALEEDDTYSGILIKNDSLLTVDYELETSTDDPYYSSLFKKGQNPLSNLEESVISITNPVPTVNELEFGKKTKFNSPSITMIPFDAYGGIIYGIAIHSGWGSFTPP